MNTFGRAFLGISVECARCHDHKYDPITQKEFYRLFSFFNSVNETGQIPYSGVPSPTVHGRGDASGEEMVARDPDAAARWRRRRALGIGSAVTRPGSRSGDARAGCSIASISRPDRLSAARRRPHRARDDQARSRRRRRRPKRVEYRAYENLVRQAPKDARLRRRQGSPAEDGPRQVGQAQKLVGDSYIEVGGQAHVFRAQQPFSFGLWFRIDGRARQGRFVTRSGGVFNGNRGYEVMLRADGTFTAGLHHVAPDNSIEIETTRAGDAGGVASPGADLRRVEPRGAACGCSSTASSPTTRVLVDHLQQSMIYERRQEERAGATPRRCASAGGTTRRCRTCRSTSSASTIGSSRRSRSRSRRRRGSARRRAARRRSRTRSDAAAGGAPRALRAARGARVREAVRRADLAARQGERRS